MKVTVFPTCLVELVRPAVAKATVRVLQRQGHDVTVAKAATCCGQPAWNSGFAPEARRVARRTLRALAKSDGPIVLPSGSCTAMIQHYWPALFAGTPDEAAAHNVAGRVQELSGFLAAEAGAPAVAHADRTVAFHDSCHMLRILRLRDEPRRALAERNIEVAEQPAAAGQRCCGFGGTFSMKLPEISTAMADEKLDDIVATGAKELVGCDLSCLVHLDGRARRRGLQLDVRHLAEVIDE